LLVARETSNIPGQRLQFVQIPGGCMFLWRSVPRVLFAAFFLLFSAAGAFAAPDPAAAAGNTAWTLTATTLVLFMTLPGLALFYGGLVQARNVLSVLMHCFAICCLVSILWMAAGYSLAFGDSQGWIGALDKAFLGGLGTHAQSGLPESVFVMFQMTFAIITPALIIGAFPERVTFPFVLVFTALWLMVGYVPVAHWVWGGGWLASMGVIDFAGGIVVHTSAGVAALVCALTIGARRGFPNHLMPPHNPGMTMAGAAMLWVGWFGFNGGSALAADANAGQAILVTHLAASSAAVTWMVVEWVKFGKPSSIGLVTGMVAGLATITPAAGVVGPAGALVFGVAAGLLCFTVTRYIKFTLKIDDSLDVFAVHGVGGILGSLLLAVFAAPSLGGVGLPEGATVGSQLVVQAIGIGVAAAWSGIVTFVILVGFKAASGLRVSQEEEHDGLDLTAHGERAYDLK
jgi:Amt family ammonium transporter